MAGESRDSSRMVEFMFAITRGCVDTTRWERWIIKWKKPFCTVFVLSILVISLIALIVLYSVICYRLWRRSIPGEVSSNQQALATRTARKVTILMIFIVAVFFISWAPIFMSMLAEVIEINFAYESIMREYPFLTAISFWLVVNNSACNSCLYFLFIESFRQGLKLLCSNCRPPRLRLRRFRWKYETGEPVNVLNPEERAVESRTFCNTHITQVTPLQ